MFKWTNNRIIMLAVVLAFGMWLPAGMALAGGYYYGGYGHHGYGHHYGYGHGYGYGGHDYGHHYAYYGLGLYALHGLYSHHSDHDYGHHDYGRHYYTPYYSHYSSPYSYGYSSYSHEPRTYSNQDGARITHSRDGWKLMKNNHPNEALNAFAIEAQDHPAKGMPKVGYALASAETGQLDRGVWAMRRALRFDPESLHYVAVDQSLQTRIRALIHRYDYDSASAKSTDAAFMRASLHYLIRESTEAKHAMDQVVQGRDDTVSAKNLKKLIHETL
ncbi:MAG: hypothetical protein Q9M27_04110 [Mariprofundaceae bacterium]|nr:hypothetical protein [Mariprofundaceae bacterium]